MHYILLRNHDWYQILFKKNNWCQIKVIKRLITCLSRVEFLISVFFHFVFYMSFTPLIFYQGDKKNFKTNFIQLKIIFYKTLFFIQLITPKKKYILIQYFKGQRPNNVNIQGVGILFFFFLGKDVEILYPL